MARLAITGLISNLDTDSIINSLLEIQRAPIRLLEQKQAVENNRLVALQNLNARMLSVSVAAQRLAQAQTFQGKQATSSNTSVLSVRVNHLAALGTHSIEVQALAQAQSFAGASFSSFTEALGFEGQFLMDGRLVTVESTDTLNDLVTSINTQVSTVRASVLQVGEDAYCLVVTRRASGAETVELFEAGASGILQSLGLVSGSTTLANPVENGGSSGGFADDTTAVGALLELASPAPSGTITLDDGSGPIHVLVNLESNSLQDIAAAINAEAALQGSTVSASVVSEEMDGGMVYRLEITGAAPVSFTDDNHVLEALQVLRPELADEVQSGQDAALVVDGLSLTRKSNSISDIFVGVTLFLSSADPGKPVTLSITQDPSATASVVQNFVDSYNAARLYIRELTAFDAETQSAGPLLGDSAVLSVERNLFDIVGASVPNILLRDLSELNGGAGVDPGRIQMTDRSGATAEIDLSSATSVQDVINAINRESALSVVASANAAGDGIQLQDTSQGYGTFQVSDLGAGSMAADLGLAASTRGDYIYGASVTDRGFASLVDIGITSNNNGTLNFDSSRLSQAMAANPKWVERLFTATDAGVGRVARSRLEFITRASGGTISNRTQAIQNIIDDIDDRKEAAERRILMVEERLQRQFLVLEQTLAELQSQNEFLNNQLYNLGNVFAYQRNRR